MDFMVFRKKLLGELTDFLHLVGGEGRGALGDLGLCQMNTAVRHCHWRRSFPLGPDFVCLKRRVPEG